jgi:cytoskeletal protein CcmA (bactofilin family)
MAGNEVCIGQNITVSFARNTQATIRVRGDVSGDIITDRGDVTIAGNVGGEIKTRFGDVIVNGDCGSITTYSGDAVVGGDAQGYVTSQSGNISIERIDEDPRES